MWGERRDSSRRHRDARLAVASKNGQRRTEVHFVVGLTIIITSSLSTGLVRLNQNVFAVSLVKPIQTVEALLCGIAGLQGSRRLRVQRAQYPTFVLRVSGMQVQFCVT